MRFFVISYIYWLALIPAMIFLYILFRHLAIKKTKDAFNGNLLLKLTESFSKRKTIIKFILELSVVGLLILTLARPQSGTSVQKEKIQGVEAVIIADVSPSMLAEDTKPSRLEYMKVVLKQLVQQMSGDKIGIVALSGSSMLISPLTSDTSAIEMYIESLTVNSISSQGTDFKEGFRIALETLERGGTVDKDDENVGSTAGQVMILASDGENHEGGAKEAVQKIQKKGIHLFTLTFGTEKGSLIPFRDERNNLVNYKKNKKGEPVLSTSRHELLKELAQIGQGKAYFADYDKQGVQFLKRDLDRLEKGDFESRETTNYNERFQIPLMLCLILALIEMALSNRKKNLKKINS